MIAYPNELHLIDGTKKSSADETEARQGLVSRFGGLPLALTIAGAWCRKKRMTALAYLRTHGTTLDDPGVDAVFKAMRPTLDALQTDPSNETLKQVLSVVAFGSADSIRLKLLLMATRATREHVVELCNMALLSSLGPARSRSLARDMEAEFDELYGIHRVVQEAVRRDADEAVAVRALLEASARFGRGDASAAAWSWNRLVLPHLDALLNHLDAAKGSGSIPQGVDAEDVAHLLEYVGGIRLDLQDLIIAEARYEEALQMYLEVYGVGARNADIANTLGNLSGVLRNQQKLAEAQARYGEALQMYLEVYGAGARNASIASTLNNLGFVLEQQGKYHEAASCRRKARPATPPEPCAHKKKRARLHTG